MAHSTSTTRSILPYRSISHPTALVLLALSLVALFAASPARAAREYLQLFVTEPYLELHTAPGRGYPVTQVVPRGDSVDVIMRRTEWFKVRTSRGIEGWASQRDLIKATLADGTPFSFDLGDRAGFTDHNWEMGVLGGDYGGATFISAYLSRSLNEHLKIELALGQFLGNASNGYTADIGLAHVLFPEWRLSPFVTLGTGLVNVEPKATLVAPLDRADQTAYVGGGLRFYWTRRFFFRAEYKSHLVFTSRNENEEIDEWKAGLAFFF